VNFAIPQFILLHTGVHIFKNLACLASKKVCRTRRKSLLFEPGRQATPGQQTSVLLFWPVPAEVSEKENPRYASPKAKQLFIKSRVQQDKDFDFVRDQDCDLVKPAGSDRDPNIYIIEI
jgi:hypothetical protein